MALKKNTEVNYFSLLCWSAFLITVILTPWANSDSLIIPKLIVLFCVALFFLPLTVTLWRNISKNKVGKILIALSMLIIIQLILIIFTSGAPFEQQFFGRTGRKKPPGFGNREIRRKFYKQSQTKNIKYISCCRAVYIFPPAREY